jgi:hypothetical protein
VAHPEIQAVTLHLEALLPTVEGLEPIIYQAHGFPVFFISEVGLVVLHLEGI